MSSGERSILFRSRGALPAGAEGVALTPAAACFGTIAWAVVPGSTMPLTGEKLPKGEPNIPIGGQDFVADAALGGEEGFHKKWRDFIRSGGVS